MSKKCSSDGKCDACLANKGKHSPKPEGYRLTLEGMEKCFVEEVTQWDDPLLGHVTWLDCKPIFPAKETEE